MLDTGAHLQLLIKKLQLPVHLLGFVFFLRQQLLEHGLRAEDVK